MHIHGTLPVIPTPFYQGKIDYQSLERLVERLFPALEGYTLCGSTGEAVSLSSSEREELMRFAVRNTPAGKSVVVGLTHTDVREAARLARVAEDLGFAAGLVPAPYYFPNSLEMVVEYFRVLDRASGLPLIFYDNPIYTKIMVSVDGVLKLFDECSHLAGLKLTDHDLSKISGIKQRRAIPIFAGDDITAFNSLLLGVDGSMIIAPGIFPEDYQQVVRQVEAGRWHEALRLFAARILPFIQVFGPGDEVSTTKALLHHLGIFRSAEVRPPLITSSAERAQQVIVAYEVCEAGAAMPAPAATVS